MAAQNNKRAVKPRGKPFKKGQSGNPGGRPKINTELRDMVREALSGGMSGNKAVDTILEVMQGGDAGERLSAAVKALEFGWGKPTQQVEHSGGIAVSRMSNDELRTRAMEILERMKAGD